MTYAFWMILVAAVLPYLTVGTAKFAGGDYDNASPRIWSTTLTGWRARAYAAHQNHFEAFPPFAAAVIVATLAGASPPLVDRLAIAFVLLRVAYTAIYIRGNARLRSVAWTLGLICVVALFAAGAWRL
jgi:uncharacterized MAPEG superfamily protein